MLGASNESRIVKVLRRMTRQERAAYLVKYAIAFGKTYKMVKSRSGLKRVRR
jgi:hypothetical protein